MPWRAFLCVLNAMRAYSMNPVDEFFGANRKQISSAGHFKSNFVVGRGRKEASMGKKGLQLCPGEHISLF